MSVITRYAEYAAKMVGSYKEVEDNIERTNYITIDDLMLRGNNRKNIYNPERIRIGSGGRKRSKLGFSNG